MSDEHIVIILSEQTGTVLGKFNLPDELMKRVEKKARAKRISVPAFIKQALQDAGKGEKDEHKN